MSSVLLIHSVPLWFVVNRDYYIWVTHTSPDKRLNDLTPSGMNRPEELYRTSRRNGFLQKH